MRFLQMILVVWALLLVGATQASLVQARQTSPVPFSHALHDCANPPPVPPPSGSISSKSPTASIHINEVLLLPSIASGWNCQSDPQLSTTGRQQQNIWIELYNDSDQNFDLYQHRVELDADSTTGYLLPIGSYIAAHDFLVLFPFTSNPHFNTSTKSITLRIDGVQSDPTLNVPQLEADQSYARTSDGTGDWQRCNTPTINASNSIQQATPTSEADDPSSGSGHGSPTHTSQTKHKGKTSSGTSTANEGSDDSTIPSRGNSQQPIRWQQLQKLETPQAVAPAQSSSSTPSTANSVVPDHRLLLSLLFIALVATLYWCWRLFRSP